MSDKTKKRVSDYNPTGFPECEEIDIKDILGKEVTIEDIVFTTGQYGEFSFIKIRKEGDKKSSAFACGGAVVIRKLRAVGEEQGFPLLGVFTKPGDYYDVA